MFRDVMAVGQRLERMDEIAGSLLRPKAAVILDQQNRWALEDSFGPRVSGIHYLETVQAHHAALWQLGIPADVIDMDCPLEDYGLVIAPMLYMLRPGVAEKLTAFVQRGGTLVGTYQTGLVNENDLCFEGRVPHGLTELFGLHREEIDSLWDGQENHMTWENKNYSLTELCERVHPTTARVLATYEEDFYAGEPALLENACGQGKAYYMAARAGADFLLDFYRMTAPQSGTAPCIRAELPAGVTANCREKGEMDYLFLQNWNDYPVSVSLHESLTDFDTEADAGSTVPLDRYEVKIFRRRKHG